MISYNNPYLLLNADLDRGSAEMDRLMAGIWWPGRRLVNILTLVWPEPEVQVDGEGLLRVGDGDGLDLLGAEVDLDELGDGVANLKKKSNILFRENYCSKKLQHCIYNFLKDHTYMSCLFCHSRFCIICWCCFISRHCFRFLVFSISIDKVSASSSVFFDFDLPLTYSIESLSRDIF